MLASAEAEVRVPRASARSLKVVFIVYSFVFGWGYATAGIVRLWTWKTLGWIKLWWLVGVVLSEKLI